MKMNKFENLNIWEKLDTIHQALDYETILIEILQWLPIEKANDILHDIASAYDIEYYYNLDNA